MWVVTAILLSDNNKRDVNVYKVDQTHFHNTDLLLFFLFRIGFTVVRKPKPGATPTPVPTQPATPVKTPTRPGPTKLPATAKPSRGVD